MKEFFNNSIILKFILAFTLIQKSFQDGIQQIYSPKQLNQVTLSDQWMPLSIVVANQSNLVFVSSGFDGIQVVDKFGGKIYLSLNFSDNYIQAFQVTQNGQTLFVAVNQTLQVYSLSYQEMSQDVVKMKQLSIIKLLNFTQIILSMTYVEELELLFAGGHQGSIVVYDTFNKSGIYQASSYTIQDTSILNFFISKDFQFLFVSAFQAGLFIFRLELKNITAINNVRQLNFILSGQGLPGFQASGFLATYDLIVYCYDIWTGLYFANFQSLNQLSANSSPIQANFTLYEPQKQRTLILSQLILNKEETTLIVGVRSYGIFVLDIKKRNQIKLFQQIGPYSEISSIQLSPDQNFLYVSSVSSLYTFYQIQVNLNDYYPNLFNMHQSKFYQLDNFNYRACQIDPSDQYLFGTYDVRGTYVYPFYKNPYRLNVNNAKYYQIFANQVQFDITGKYIILPQYYQGDILSIYQVSPLDNTPYQQQISPMNMKLIKSYPYDNTYFTETFSFNLDRTMAVQPIQFGVNLYNSTDILNLQIYSVWKRPEFVLSGINGACISQDNKWMVASARTVGFLVVNIQDKSDPQLASYYLNSGAEGIVSSLYYNYIYLIDGTKGFAIIDTSFFPKINIISRIKLLGSSIFGLLLQNEDYIIIAQSDIGMVTLINIKDKLFPQIVSSANYLNENAAALCVCHKINQIFITTTNGILTLPFKSEIKIHTVVYQIKQYSSSQFRKQKYPQASIKGSKSSPRIMNEYIFQTGQTISLDFEIIYPTNLYMKIIKIYFYSSQIQSDIPSFFSFNFQQQSLQMYIDQSLGNSNYVPQQNMILIKTQIPLDITSFIYSAEDSYDLAITNSNQSAAIYNSMLSQNILDSDGTINDKFDFYKNLVLDSQLTSQLVKLSQNKALLNETAIEQIAQKISLTLKQSYYLNPFKFYVVPSLQFDNQNIFQFIKSNSLNQVEVTLQINSNDGKLIQKNQVSVIFQMSQSKDQLKISGTLANVNKVLQQKIIFANSTAYQEQDSPKITITINDNINFPLTLTQSIYESNFIALKSSIKLNEKLSLQQQLNNQFQGGIVNIESDIAISFTSNTFYVKDSKQITYSTLYQSSDGNFTQIPPSLWLQQMSNDKMNFKGATTSQIYGQKFQFKVIATDGYTTAEDYFIVEVSGIPFTYALNLLLKILGPLLAVFGIYKERFTFYNIIFKKYVTFSDEEVMCGNSFKKKIIIISDEQRDATFIFDNLIKCIKQKSKVQQEKDLDRSPTSLKKKIDDIPQEREATDIEVLSQLQKNNKQDFESKIDSQYAQRIQKELFTTGYQSNSSEIERRYLDKEGCLILSQVIQDVVDFQIKPNSYNQKSQEQYFEEISDPNSLLQRILRALVARHLLNLDKRSLIIYQYIKNYCFQKIQQNINDWYKAIVKITQNQDQELKNKEEYILLPQLQLNYSILSAILKSLGILNQQNLNSPTHQVPQTIGQFKQLIDQNKLKINLYLIREVIFADALGFPKNFPNRFQPSVGQCIYMNFYQISQIIAYKKRKVFQFLRPIYRLLNMEYTKYGFSKNMRLPNWLKFKQKNNLILLQGTPQKCDIEDILIKIFDKSGYLEPFSRKINEVYNETDEFYKQEDLIHSKIHFQSKQMSNRSPKISFQKNSQYQSEAVEDSIQSIFKNRTQKNSPILEILSTNQCFLQKTNNQYTQREQNCYSNLDDQQNEVQAKNLINLTTNSNNNTQADTSPKQPIKIIKERNKRIIDFVKNSKKENQQMKEFFNNSIILKFILTFTLIQKSFQDDIQQIYSPKQLNQVTLSDQWMPLSIVVTNENNLVFVSSGFDGIQVVDKFGGKIYLSLNFSDSYIQAFQVAQNGQTLFVAVNQTLQVYSLSYQEMNQDVVKMKQLNMIKLLNFTQIILSMAYVEELELLFVGGHQGSIVVYDTFNKSGIYQVSSYTIQDTSILNFFISKDFQFLFVSAFQAGLYVFGLELKNITAINNARQLNLRLSGQGLPGYQASGCLATQDLTVYCYDIWTGLYFTNFQSLKQLSANSSPIQANFTLYEPQKQRTLILSQLILNKEETILIVGVRSYGIFVLDIKKRNQIKLFQQIGPYSEISSIQLSPDQNFLYVSSVSSLYTFYQIQVNLNDDYPNLFNMHQSNFYQIDNFIYRECKVDPSDQYLFGTFDYEGMHVYPFYRNPYRLNVTNSKYYHIYANQIQFDITGKYIIVPQYYQGDILSIYQVSPLDNTPQQQQISPMNMKLVKSHPYDNTYFTETFSYNLDRTMAVQPIEIGVNLYNSTDILNLQIYSVWKRPDFILGGLNGACISQDNKWMVVSARTVGFLVVNIEDKSDPKLASYYLNSGAEGIISSLYYNYIYLIDGTKGFAIIDTSFFPKINIISRIKLLGNAIFGLLLQNEDYIIIAQNDIGMATLINIKDKLFPQIVSSANYLNENAGAVCVCNKMNQIFITTTNGILTLPFKSEIKIHTAVYLIKQYSSSQFRKQKYPQASIKGSNSSPSIMNEYIFQTGQTISLDFEIIYPTNLYMKIIKIYFYSSQIQSDIPSFFSFNFQQQSLQMYIDQSLGNSNYVPQQNMILIKTQIPLDITSFIYSAEDSYDLAITNSDQSAAIYNSMLSQNILNSDGTINDKFDFYKNLVLDSQLTSQLVKLSQNKALLNETAIEQVAQKISLTLKKSYFLNPFKFYVVSSLQFDNQNIFQFIKTNSLNQVEVTLQINSNDGKLIQKNQVSVIFQMSQSKDQLKISGTLANVNKVLQQKIIFANSTAYSEQDSPKITITINDNINFPLTITQSIYESNFITLKSSIKLNEKLNLQQQLNNQFQGGIVNIESDIAISFTSNTFYVKDSKQITYSTLYQSSDGNFTQIPPSLWLQQMSNDKMNFKGATTSQIYGQKFQFKVIATDGYTTAEDYFIVEVSGIPFTYALNLLLKILGPLLAVFGIYKERFTFYNIIFKKSITFSDEEVICGNQFQKRIIIISDEYRDATFIFDNLIKCIKQKSKAQQEKDLDRSPTILKKIDDIPQEREASNEKQTDIEEFSKLEKNNKQDFDSKIDSQYAQRIQKELFTTGYYSNSSEIERRYLDKEGGLILSQVIQDVVDFQIKPNSYNQKSQEQYFEEISDPNSLLQRILRALVARHLLNLDKRSLIIYQYIKNYCFQKIQQNINDWYKAIVKITQNQDQELKNKEEYILLPQLQLNYSILNAILKSLGILNQQNLNSPTHQVPQTIGQFKKLIDQNNLKINLYLIREVIFADALGFPEKLPNRFQPSVGQCIYMNFYQMNQIIAYKKRKIFQFLRPIYRLLNMEYTKYGFSKNMRLPNWIQFNQKNNLILLQGTPQKCDIDEILVKIFDKSGYVINQFILKVTYRKKERLELFSRKINEVYNETDEFYQQEDLIHSKIHFQSKQMSNRSPKISFQKNSQYQSEAVEDSMQSIFKNRTQKNNPNLEILSTNQCFLKKTNNQYTQREQNCYSNLDNQQNEGQAKNLINLTTNSNNNTQTDTSPKKTIRIQQFDLNQIDEINQIS
ncbi:hypothetical protein ABPG73_004994 [Tetrahymena malaccensis]